MEVSETYNQILTLDTFWNYLILSVAFIILLFYYLRKVLQKIQFKKLISLLDRRILDFTKDEIKLRIRHYIWHDCQSTDPQNKNQIGRIAPFRGNIIARMDQLILNEPSVKHIFLMAAGGMGKTSFLLNYFAYLNRKLAKKFYVELVPMSLKNVYKRLKEIEQPSNAILLLDGYDEIIDTQNTNLFRLDNLMSSTREFYKVITTCHVQSIPQDNIIPKRSPEKIKKYSPVVEKEYWPFVKLYLSAFNREQITQYIKRRLTLRQRKNAIQFVNELPDFAVRPFYLEYINDLCNTFVSLHNSYQVYNEIMEAWLNKEYNTNFVQDEQSLHDFVLLIALKIYLNRETWKGDYIPHNEINIIANKFNHKCPVKLKII